MMTKGARRNFDGFRAGNFNNAYPAASGRAGDCGDCVCIHAWAFACKPTRSASGRASNQFMLRMASFGVRIFAGKYDEFSKVSLTGAMGPDFIVSPQGDMNDPSVVGIHISNSNGSTDALAFVGHPLGMPDEIFFSVL